MFAFLRKKIDSAGSVMFRGTIPPRLENLELLRDKSVVVQPRPTGPESYWAARVRHPQWGEADLLCPRMTRVLPRALIELDRRLLSSEVSEITACGSSVQVHMRHEPQNVLHTRKLALRLMRAVMGEYGVSVVDHGSHRFWSRAALDEELAHDADLDIESLFVLHAITRGNSDDPSVVWLHSHGLAELGYFDFDILEPSSNLAGNLGELTRALAFGIVEGWIQMDSSNIELADPGGTIRLVPSDVFQRRAAERFTSLRDDPERQHCWQRAVVCEPVARSWWRLRGERIEPSRWLRGPIGEEILIRYSHAATDLMARRARGSYAMCRRYLDEFRELDVKALVKIGVLMDGASDNEREHLWFEVTNLDEDRITGTLLNQPWHIAGLIPGQTCTYGLDALTDWALYTPAGAITPVDAVAARLLRDNREEFLQSRQSDG